MPVPSVIESLPVWVLVFFCFPALLVAYFALVVGAGGAIGYEYRSKHEDLLYLPFIAAVSAAFYAADVMPVPVDVEAAHLAFVPLGIAMYAVDTYLWSWWTGKPIEGGERTGTWLLPSVLASVGEEYLMRGVLAVLIVHVGALPYVLCSAVLFGINHFVGGRREIALKTANGAVYAVAFLVTGTLVAPVLAHAAYNVAYIGFVSGHVRFPTAHG